MAPISMPIWLTRGGPGGGSRLPIALVCLAGLIAALIPHRFVSPWPQAFAPVAPAVGPAQGPGRHEVHVIDGPRGGHGHAPALLALDGGRLMAVWWWGRIEAGPGVTLFRSVFENGRWSERAPIKTPRGLGLELGRPIKTIGNPTLIRRPDGRIELFFVSVSVGGWSGASVNRMVSEDGGLSFGPARRLWTSPVLNLSTLVKTKPVLFADGAIGLPTYHELTALRSELTLIDDRGRAIDRRRLSNHLPALQPDLVVLGPGEAIAYHRPTARTPSVLQNRTRDAGASWTPLEPTPLMTPDSAVAALALGPDDLIVVYTEGAELRRNLILARSRDGGRTFRDIHRFEDDAARDPRLVAYPWLTVTADGLIHLAYAADSYATLRHVVFDRAWIESRP